MVTVRQAVNRRRNWITRNPEDAAMYVRLNARDKAKIDHLFETDQTRKVTQAVHRLDEERRVKKRIVFRRKQALDNIRNQVSYKPKYHDTAVIERITDIMTPDQLTFAAKASEDDIIELAKLQYDRNPFWYH